MKTAAGLMLSAWLATMPAAADAAQPALVPFVIDYDVRYGSFAMGTSRTELTRGAAAGQWIIESKSDASGLGRLYASGTISYRSNFQLDGIAVRPLSFRLDDGSSRTDRDVTLEFDWRAGRVRGTAEDEPVDLTAETGLQDAFSIQALVLARLRSGAEPGLIPMIEKDRIKHYRYTLLRRERLETAIGVLDTVVYRSARDGSSRETLTWHAPSLGFAAVQAEQRRDGRRTFRTLVRRFQAGN